MRLLCYIFLLSILLLSCSEERVSYHKWDKIELSFKGPMSSEKDVINPFLDYRLEVSFYHGDESIVVPGFYAADGQAHESGAVEGDIWKVRFAPHLEGDWTYEAKMVSGTNVAVDQTVLGTPVAISPAKGQFSVSGPITASSDLRSKGRILYDGSRYPRYAEDHSMFLKGGANSPENFLAYQDFDGTYTYDTSSLALKTYSPHIQDWKPGDPTWQGEKGKGIIGALNYLASKQMNVIYFLTMNISGDGKDVWPYISHEDYTRFDVSKLDQWDIVFSHAERLGIALNIVTQETENETLLDNGDTGLHRSLYYRELVARFGYLNGLFWNLGEENGWANWSAVSQNDQQRRQMIDWFTAHDPFDHPILLHTHSEMKNRDTIIEPLLGYEDLDGLSVQIADAYEVHEEFLKNWNRSKAAEHTWVQGMDEIGWWWRGAMPDLADPNQDTMRTQVLWGSLMGGGYGVEWYFGYNYDCNDLNCENWRTRDHLWDLTRIALDFFRGVDDLTAYYPVDSSLTDGAWGLTNGEDYIIYSSSGMKTTLSTNLKDGAADFYWYNPLTGESSSEPVKISNGGTLSLSPPEMITADWALRITR